MTVTVILPSALQALAQCSARVQLEVPAPITQRHVILALEARYPALSGVIINPANGCRRPLLRFFGGREDLSHHDPDAPLPAPVASGEDEFIILGAIAGG